MFGDERVSACVFVGDESVSAMVCVGDEIVSACVFDGDKNRLRGCSGLDIKHILACFFEMKASPRLFAFGDERISARFCLEMRASPRVFFLR